MTGKPILSQEQRSAVRRIRQLIGDKCNLIALAGPAGSGKTTLIHQLKKELQQEVVVSAMTNKAANVLRRKGLLDAITTYKACLVPMFKEPGDEIIKYFNLDDPNNPELKAKLTKYFDSEVLDEAWQIAQRSGITAGARMLKIEDFFREYFSGWGPREERKGVLIIDEASMLGGELLSTIRKSFSQIILVGDEFQLPPVKDEAVFWDDVVIEERVRLRQVHRQAKFSQPLRVAEVIKSGSYVQMEPVKPIDIELCANGKPIIVWRNEVRKTLTKKIRYALGYIGSSPEVGEILVCKENRSISGVDFVNNSMWKVVKTDGGDNCMLEDLDGQRTKGLIEVQMEEYDHRGHGLPCRYGYVLTCHTAQGSEWPSVMVHASDARSCLGRDRDFGLKWLYTAVTRAEKELIWVNGKISS